MQKPEEIRKAEKRVSEDAARFANQRVRKELTDPNSRLAQKLSRLDPTKLSMLQRSWNPIVAEWDAHGVFTLKIRPTDALVLWDEEIRDELDAIAVEVTDESIRKNSKLFLGAALRDLLHGDYYTRHAS